MPSRRAGLDAGRSATTPRGAIALVLISLAACQAVAQGRMAVGNAATMAAERASGPIETRYVDAGGREASPDYTELRERYEKAAAAGQTAAMNGLGALYAEGHGAARDYGKAREWFEKAAAAGNIAAMSNLAHLYAHGMGVPQDYGKARAWYEKASAAGLGRSALGVGWTSLFLHDFARALSVSDAAHRVAPADLALEINRAHALMFLGRTNEARAIYLAHPGQTLPDQDNKIWQQVVVEDFAELRKGGLDNPLMTEIETDFAAHKK